MINLSQQMRLGLKLTPQQVQYLKLLQLPTMALEQRIKTELEVNPLLETTEEIDQDAEQVEPEEAAAESEDGEKSESTTEDSYTLEDYLNDDAAGYKSPESYAPRDEEEEYERPITSSVPMSERLLSQFRLQCADDTDFLIAEEIIGNVDEDGYLRR
jgi:RNA polymerase sigma-54 factor